MGKDLRGKELGVGISQRKDGLYTARFTDRLGKRRQQYFKKLQECRKWLADARFEDDHGEISASGNMAVSAWFDYWAENIKSANVKERTVQNYKDMFNKHIKPYIGSILLRETKPIHCQNVLNQMADAGYKNSTIKQVRTLMKMIFGDAVENEIIFKNPVTKTVNSTKGKESDVKYALTVREQGMLLKLTEKQSYHLQYSLVLQTGIRVGELVGLKWSDVDFENKVLHISCTTGRINGELVTGTPKSKSGTREIPLTNEAVRVLKKAKEGKKDIKVSSIQFHDTIFVTKNGRPIDKNNYDDALKRICKKNNLPHASMHTLRHTFATRCIEAGMKPKTLQYILGHSDINTTMNIYVHVTKEEKTKEMECIEQALKTI